MVELPPCLLLVSNRDPVRGMTRVRILRGRHLKAAAEALRSLRQRPQRGEHRADLDAYEYVHYANAILAEALKASREFDLIHSHLGCSYAPYGQATATSMLHTLHIALSPDDRWVLTKYPHTEIAAVSHSQASAVPSQSADRCRVVHHGIDFSSVDLRTAAGEYLVFVGRMGPQKSPADAIRIAALAGMPLVLAGVPQNAEEEKYFAREVKPLIDGNRVSHVGLVDPPTKRDLLPRACALLFPIRGDEAFGLATVEAMACGTPVLALGHSSVREIVDDGITGFVASSVESLAAKTADVLRLDRRRVREYAESRFYHRRMADDYLAAYKTILMRAAAPPAATRMATERRSSYARRLEGNGSL